MFGITSPHRIMCVHIFKRTCVNPLVIPEINTIPGKIIANVLNLLIDSPAENAVKSGYRNALETLKIIRAGLL